MGGGLTGFDLFAGQLGGDVYLLGQVSWVSVHMCCMMHVLTNVGQVAKNLFLESISWSIVVQEA